MNKHAMQYPHTACARVLAHVCVCVFTEGQLSSTILKKKKKKISRALLTGTPLHAHPDTQTPEHFILLRASTVSMLRLTTQLALIPLPVTFYKQD